MMVLSIILILLFLLDGLRMRGRISALATVPDVTASQDQPEAGDFQFISVDGANLDDAIRSRAAAFADRERLDVVDLIPEDISTSRILWVTQLIDFPAYRANPLIPGRTVGEVMLMSEDVRKRSGVSAMSDATPVEMVQAAERLKRYAARSTDLAVVRGMRATRERMADRFAVTRETFHNGTLFFLAIQLVIYSLIALVLVVPAARPWGMAALIAYHLQPVIAIAGTPVKPRDLWLFALLRWPMEVYLWIRTVAGWRRPDGPDPIESRRAHYHTLLADGTARFFEPERADCPLCGSPSLSTRLRTTDLLQQKPGEFKLDKCDACGHIFQNPRLSEAGLEFYYGDFYDGLGERDMELVFASTDTAYLARAGMVKGHAEPQRWLDVGGGHGHFCTVARGVWPETRFDGLDLSESIDEAQRRKWIDQGFRGLFTELAPSIEGEYEVVSMGHYLEHTRDPVAEISAAHTALAAGGHLVIEVPDPESALGKFLGRHWIPWFQPQHQHLLSRENLKKILDDEGFVPLKWEVDEAHQKVDFFFAAVILLDRIAPPPDRPWKPRPSAAPKVWRMAVWTLGTPLLLMARVADGVLAPLIRRSGMSNAYRVLARRG